MITLSGHPLQYGSHSPVSAPHCSQLWLRWMQSWILIVHNCFLNSQTMCTWYTWEKLNLNVSLLLELLSCCINSICFFLIIVPCKRVEIQAEFERNILGVNLILITSGNRLLMTWSQEDWGGPWGPWGEETQRQVVAIGAHNVPCAPPNYLVPYHKVYRCPQCAPRPQTILYHTVPYTTIPQDILAGHNVPNFTIPRTLEVKARRPPQ